MLQETSFGPLIGEADLPERGKLGKSNALLGHYPARGCTSSRRRPSATCLPLLIGSTASRDSITASARVTALGLEHRSRGEPVPRPLRPPNPRCSHSWLTLTLKPLEQL